jgi:hypothetical protein
MAHAEPRRRGEARQPYRKSPDGKLTILTVPRGSSGVLEVGKVGTAMRASEFGPETQRSLRAYACQRKSPASFTNSCDNHRSGYDVLMHGPEILARTLTASRRKDKHGNVWQYHSRSDHHSKVACWAILFDLMNITPLLRRHIEKGVVSFGINHQIRDFVRDRTKDLDLVLCTPNGTTTGQTFAQLVQAYDIQLSDEEQRILAELPTLRRAPVGSLIMALEAKACMTAHQRALPRLYDELNSSHLTVHGNTEQALAVGFAMVNIAEKYLSPDLNKKNRMGDPEWSKHNQPRDAGLAIEKVKQLPRRSRPGETGYDALAIVAVDMPNEGSAVRLNSTPPSPQPGEIFHYDDMVSRLSGLYATRFKDLA